MIVCEPVKKKSAFARKPQDCPPLVGGILGARQESFVLRPIDKLNRAVVLQAKPLGGIRNRNDRILGNAGNLQ